MKDYPRTNREHLIITAFAEGGVFRRLVIISIYLAIGQFVYFPLLWTILFVGYHAYMAVKEHRELVQRIESILAHEPVTGQALTQEEKNSGKIYE